MKINDEKTTNNDNKTKLYIIKSIISSIYLCYYIDIFHLKDSIYSIPDINPEINQLIINCKPQIFKVTFRQSPSITISITYDDKINFKFYP